MHMIVSKAGKGKTRTMLRKAKELGGEGKSVLMLANEYTPFEVYNKLVGDNETSSIIHARQVESMEDVLRLVGILQYDAIFIDASFIDAEDVYFLYSLSEYIKTDMYITVQANRNAGVDVQILDYVTTPMGTSMTTERMLDMWNELKELGINGK